MVRGGWYHFLVLEGDGTVKCLIGDPQASKTLFQKYAACEPDGSPLNYCLEECVPVEAPAGHPLAVPTFTGKSIKDIACGAYHNIVRFTDDTIACWGLNAMGQCNVPAALANGTHAKRKKIVGLHAGYSTTAVSFNDGTVLCWGDPAVANVVNQWTDLMMSPVNNLGDPKRLDQDNVATDNFLYAKPRFSAAYSTDANLVTWNVLSDHTFSWHNEANATHCMPFFDLGCEVDPFIPLEYSPEQGDVELPGYLTEFPHWLTDGSAPCISDNFVDITTDEWKDSLQSKWRNRIFQAANYATNPASETDPTRSCCDLEVKTDYAVAMRRTGQVITTRSDNRYGGTHPCPTGQTDGRSHCRDCSADSLLDVTNDTMPNLRSNCPPNEGDSCAGYTQCACCNDQHPYQFLGCPDCSGTTCDRDQRFTISVYPANKCFSSVPRFHEGIGCMGANPHIEYFAFDPNWARAHAGDMSGRWTPGEQVRTSVHGGSNYPSSNSYPQSNWGWDTMPQPDQMVTPQNTAQDCTVLHGTNDSCNDMCKDNGSYKGGDVYPEGEPIWRYPMQMFAQGVQAGTDTVVWTLPPVRLPQNIWILDCASCGQGVACNDLQEYMPNGGELAFGCIFTGNKMVSTNAVVSNVDKYGYVNTYRGGVGLSADPCANANHMLTFDGYIAPSKPWGPYNIAITNSMGSDKNTGYPNCHCCPGGVELGPPRVARVLNPVSAPYDLGAIGNYGLDQVLGTFWGMPNEANMHCHTPPPGAGGAGGSCEQTCGSLGGTGSEDGQFGAVFCAYHPPRSVASTRMAFAMIRADHRALDENGDRMEPLGDCGGYDDPAEYVPCELVDGDYQVRQRSELVVHIWGSLWDPCPPWPRYCDCSFAPEVKPEESWSLMEPIFYTPCDNDSNTHHPEGAKAEECYPDANAPGLSGWDASWGTCARYPKWTKVPSSNTGRSSNKGHWSGSSWVFDTPSACEPRGTNTRYAPKCDGPQQWHLQGNQE